MIRKLRIWEFVAIGIILCLLVAIVLPILSRSREASNRASCQNNLKQMGIVMKMYSGENRGNLPPLSPYPDNWMFDVPRVVPEYLTDLSTLVCPNSPFAYPDVFTARNGSNTPTADCVTSLFYIYTGYAISSDEQALALFEAFQNGKALRWSKNPLSLEVPIFKGSDRVSIPGLRGIPILWDRVPLDDRDMSHRNPLGINVLHMDGHVEFVGYSLYNNSNFFPATRISAETFGSVLPRLPATCRGL